MKRYIQSIHSSTAPLFELGQEYDAHWIAKEKGNLYSFLKSEYHEVPAPERWVEVPIRVIEAFHSKTTYDPGGVYHGDTKIAELFCKGKYRIKTLVVERKEEP